MCGSNCCWHAFGPHQPSITPTCIYETVDQIMQTPISPSPNDADLFSGGTRGDTTCQPCLQGLTALPDSISLAWFYLSAHTMEKNKQLVYANHKGQRGGCEREMDTKRDGRRVELPGKASMSIPGWELSGIFASRGAESCGSCPCNRRALEDPRMFLSKSRGW